MNELIDHINERDDRLANRLIAAMLGLSAGTGFDSFQRRSSKPKTQCLLPDCKELTDHNGGYCSADHCHKHRHQMKGKQCPK